MFTLTGAKCCCPAYKLAFSARAQVLNKVPFWSTLNLSYGARCKVLSVPKLARMLCQDSSAFAAITSDQSLQSHIRHVFGDVKMTLETQNLCNGILNHDRSSLARGITLVETTNLVKRQQAQLLLTDVLHHMKLENEKNESGLKTFRIGEIFIFLQFCFI